MGASTFGLLSEFFCLRFINPTSTLPYTGRIASSPVAAFKGGLQQKQQKEQYLQQVLQISEVRLAVPPAQRPKKKEACHRLAEWPAGSVGLARLSCRFVRLPHARASMVPLAARLVLLMAGRRPEENDTVALSDARCARGLCVLVGWCRASTIFRACGLCSSHPSLSPQGGW